MTDKKKAIILLIVGLFIFFLVKVVIAGDVSCKTYSGNPIKYFGSVVAGVNAAPREPVRERSLGDLWIVVERQCQLYPYVKLSGLITYNRFISQNMYAPEEGYGWIIYTADGERMLQKKWYIKEKE